MTPEQYIKALEDLLTEHGYAYVSTEFGRIDIGGCECCSDTAFQGEWETRNYTVRELVEAWTLKGQGVKQEGEPK